MPVLAVPAALTASGALAQPNGGGEPPAVLIRKIEASFGKLDARKKELAAAATTRFGSGWAWPVLDGDKLKVVKTGNADVPMTTDETLRQRTLVDGSLNGVAKPS
jgi:superoxide dismutase